ncbi:MAG: hypothetical protein CL868_20200 [Cytophagaceae bacterium]|nr:hypothetical protein [Cytophagaceae bacterium]|tara:strand:+ start:582 stop:881 length:300 start_codon:yes stop_codon:yes gene_type:complete
MKTKKKEEHLDYDPNLSKEEKRMLNDENIHKDGGEDDELRERVDQVDFTGEDLDVPGTPVDKKRKQNDLKDEENQVYSQGGEMENNDPEEQNADLVDEK